MLETTKQTTTDKLLDDLAAADILGINPRTLAVWRCTKRYAIPYVKVGRSVRYRLSDLQNWVDSRTCELTAASE